MRHTRYGRSFDERDERAEASSICSSLIGSMNIIRGIGSSLPQSQNAVRGLGEHTLRWGRSWPRLWRRSLARRRLIQNATGPKNLLVLQHYLRQKSTRLEYVPPRIAAFAAI